MATANETSITTLSLLIAAGQAAALTAAQVKGWMFNRVNTIANGLIQKYRVNDEFDVNVDYDVNNVPESEEIA
jgi:hypothetical protein